MLLRAVRVRARGRRRQPGRLPPPVPQAEVPAPAAHRSSRCRPRKAAPAGYRITIDGPFSLFESVTKYGLQLALAYPAIAACGRSTLEADLRWGKERRPLRFVVSAATPSETARRPTCRRCPTRWRPLLRRAGRSRRTAPGASRAASRPDRPARRRRAVPDLELRHTRAAARVLLEVLGFWSRDAVWKRIELAERGLPDPIVFAVSKHLRVSEAALPDDLPAALYVYAHTMSARAVLEKAAACARRKWGLTCTPAASRRACDGRLACSPSPRSPPGPVSRAGLGRADRPHRRRRPCCEAGRPRALRGRAWPGGLGGWVSRPRPHVQGPPTRRAEVQVRPHVPPTLSGR